MDATIQRFLQICFSEIILSRQVVSHNKTDINLENKSYPIISNQMILKSSEKCTCKVETKLSEQGQ